MNVVNVVGIDKPWPLRILQKLSPWLPALAVTLLLKTKQFDIWVNEGRGWNRHTPHLADDDEGGI